MREAFQYRQVDRQHELHELAYLNFAATATKKKGKPVYKNFKKFYDYKKELEKVKREQGGIEIDRHNQRIADIGKILYSGGENIDG